MTVVRASIIVTWAMFWTYWLGSALAAKRSVRGSGRRDLVLRGMTGLAIALLLAVSSTIVLLLAGLAFAVWARVHLGDNWGMPMTQRAEPELVTSGPYTYVRHPIYSGLLLAGLGTSLAVNLIGLPLLMLLLGYFLISARIEERHLGAVFPDSYPAYVARSKSLVPFVI
jgi:protein-S-isoprenylcysteine O-methyltransferase Ste14